MLRFVFLISFALISQVKANVSVFELKSDFSKHHCEMVAIKTDVPDIFETIVGYTGGSEVASEKAVSNYRKYFMSLSSRARISSQEARDARLEILRISKAKKLKWSEDWHKNDTNALFFTASIAAPVAIEVIFQKDRFNKDELNIIIDYLEFLKQSDEKSKINKK